MFSKKTIFGSLAGLGFLLGMTSGVAVAQMPVEMPASASGHTQFPPIEQPLELKVAVTVGGIALIGLDLWWFIFSKTKAAQSDKGKEGEGEQERIIN